MPIMMHFFSSSVLFLLVCLSFIPSGAGGGVLVQSAEVKVRNSVLSSAGKKDVFDELSVSDFSLDLTKKNNIGAGKFIDEIVGQMNSLFVHQILIQVVLVGFNELLEEETLIMYLNSLPVELVTIVNDKYGLHLMPIRKEHLYSIEHSSPSLINSIKLELAKTIRAAKTDTPSSKGMPCRVPVDVVDSLIYDDYKSQGLEEGIYRIYIINTGFPEGSYIYAQEGPQSCPTPMDVGHAGRYLWIDLSAGPISWGHLLSGPLITVSSLPRPGTSPLLVPEGEKIVQENNKTVEESSHLLAAVADLIRRTTHAMFAPPMDHYGVEYAAERTLLMVLIKESGVTESTEKNKKKWELIQKELKKLPLSVMKQQLKFEFIERNIDECSSCVSLWKRSTRSIMTKLSRDQDSSEVRVEVKRYIDSEVMRGLINEGYAEDLLGDYDYAFQEGKGSSFYPIFLFDVSEDVSHQLLLLDNNSCADRNQAIGFPDMAIAIQLNHNQNVSHYSDIQCYNQLVTFNTTDATKPILNAIIQGLWGVSPVLDVYDISSHQKSKQFLWSLHEYPFKKFYRETDTQHYEQWLSFRERDAVLRHQTYHAVGEILQELYGLCLKLDSFRSELSQVLSRGKTMTLFKRIILFKYKIDQAETHLSNHEYQISFFYIDNMKFDVEFIKTLIDEIGSSNQFKSYLSCKDKEDRFNWMRILALGSCVVLLVAFLIYLSKRVKAVEEE